MPELATSNMPEPEETAAMHQRMTQLFRDFYSHDTHSTSNTAQQYGVAKNINAQGHAMRATIEGDNHDNKD